MLVSCTWCGFSKDMSSDLEGKKARCPICYKEFVISPSERRTTERQTVMQIFAILEQNGKCEIKDLTQTGLSIYSYNMDSSYEIGAAISFDLLCGGKAVLRGLQAEVIHVAPDAYGCKFVSLTPSQQEKLERFLKQGVESQQDSEALDFAISALDEFIDKEN